MEATTLKDNRLKLGLSQTQLGKRLGVNRKTVLNYESGFTSIPETKAQLLNLIFNTVDYPLKEESDKVAEKVIERLIPFFTQLEISISEMKCHVEQLNVLVDIDKRIKKYEKKTTTKKNTAL